MARSEMKNVVMMIITMIMLVFVEANHSLPPQATENGIGDITCLVKCGLQCAPQLGNTVQYGICMALCELLCSKKPSQAAYVCTRSCTYSKLNNINTDARDVNAIVDLCLKTC
ncbi:uncharacterized protein LOC127135879 [Lathyrus oleraceus]|nr:uncharacterized protein LOC127135879 [Pisum sativum]